MNFQSKENEFNGQIEKYQQLLETLHAENEKLINRKEVNFLI
jgi:hypothetical protein